MRALYVNPDSATQQRATTLGCGWMPTVPAQFTDAATAPCVILSGAGQTVVLPEPTTKAAVAAAAAPILAAERAASDAEAARRATADAQEQRALDAIAELRKLKAGTSALTTQQTIRLFASVLLVLVPKAYGKHDEDD